MAFDDLPSNAVEEERLLVILETRDILDTDGNKVGELTLPNTTSEDEWTEKLNNFNYTIPEVTPEEQLLQRIEWGNYIIKEFRVYTLGISDEDGLTMLSNLMDVKMSLELGMLSAAGYLLSTKPEDPTLDAQYSENQTVRDKFVNMILYEGPTP